MAVAAASASTCTCGLSPSSLTSREIWERSHAGSGSIYTCARSVTLSNSKKAAVASAQKPSVSYTQEQKFSSSFWGQEGSSSRPLQGNHSHINRFTRSSSGAVPLVEARIFGPAIFEESKLRVLFIGKEQENGHLQQPRIYTLTHSDVTAKITLAVAPEINKAQLIGWYTQLQRDEVLAEWRRTKGEMSLHVHCHISGGNWLHDMIAMLRFYIFQRELPVVLEAFMHGDKDLFSKHPELQHAPVWVYFHSNMKEFNRLESWGPLSEAMKKGAIHQSLGEIVSEKKQQFPKPMCPTTCECCSRHAAVIPIPDSFRKLLQSQRPGLVKGKMS